MPGATQLILWAVFSATAAVLVAWATINATAPNPTVHAATIQACNGPTEISAIVGADPNAVTAFKNAARSTANITTAVGSMTTTARVAGGEYVYTIGSGANARTCHVPIAQRSQ